MAYFEHAGVIYEFTTTSPTGTDDWIVECVELSNPTGFVGSIVVPPDVSRALMTTSGQGLPVAVLRHWLTLLPEALTTPESNC